MQLVKQRETRERTQDKSWFPRLKRSMSSTGKGSCLLLSMSRSYCLCSDLTPLVSPQGARSPAPFLWRRLNAWTLAPFLQTSDPPPTTPWVSLSSASPYILPPGAFSCLVGTPSSPHLVPWGPREQLQAPSCSNCPDVKEDLEHPQDTPAPGASLGAPFTMTPFGSPSSPRSP